MKHSFNDIILPLNQCHASKASSIEVIFVFASIYWFKKINRKIYGIIRVNWEDACSREFISEEKSTALSESIEKMHAAWNLWTKKKHRESGPFVWGKITEVKKFCVHHSGPCRCQIQSYLVKSKAWISRCFFLETGNYI